jgi:hypothetical protein
MFCHNCGTKFRPDEKIEYSNEEQIPAEEQFAETTCFGVPKNGKI